VAGFFWWQGSKDAYDMALAEHYEENLVALIKALRLLYVCFLSLVPSITLIVPGSDGHTF
jgi:hypothetical protein